MSAAAPLLDVALAWCGFLAAGGASTSPGPIGPPVGLEGFEAGGVHGVRGVLGMGGDVGVFAHGDNAREMEAMVDYGMKPLDVLRSATSVNADVFRIADHAGRIKTGLPADLLVVEGDPSVAISQARKVKWVMKEGVIYMPDDEPDHTVTP